MTRPRDARDLKACNAALAVFELALPPDADPERVRVIRATWHRVWRRFVGYAATGDGHALTGLWDDTTDPGYSLPPPGNDNATGTRGRP